MRVAAIVLMTCMLFAQQPVTLPQNLTGSVDLFTELQTRLDARRAKVGDAVRLKLLQAILSKGKIAIPEGATLTGRVTEVLPRNSDNTISRLAIKIDRAEWKHNSVPFDAVVVRHARLVRKIVIRPAARTIGDSPERDPLVEAMGRAVPIQPPPTQPSTPASPPTNPPTQPPSNPPPSNPPSQPPSNPPPPPANTSPSTGVPQRPAAPQEGPTRAADVLPVRNDLDTLRVEGPHPVDVAVRISADPNIGSELVSTSRDVVVPKGTLIVLKQKRTNQP